MSSTGTGADTTTEPEKNDADDKDTKATAEEDDAASSTEEKAQQSPAEQKLQNEVADLKAKLLRSLAEQDNTRRIAARDVTDARSFAIKSFAKSLLEVSDNLERALGAVPPDSIANEPGSVLANLYEGIQLTEKGLGKAFEANGLVKFGVAGEKFDPNKHEALMEYSDSNAEHGTVGQVMKVGFMLHSRVLRPAEVGVIKNE